MWHELLAGAAGGVAGATVHVLRVRLTRPAPAVVVEPTSIVIDHDDAARIDGYADHVAAATGVELAGDVVRRGMRNYVRVAGQHKHQLEHSDEVRVVRGRRRG